jgi:hypothetical protein
MVSEPMKTRAEFTAGHAELIAEQLRDYLNHDLDAIARNEGHIYVFDRGRRAIADLTDGEVSAYLAGVRSLAMGFADWLESSGEMDYALLENGWNDLYPIRKHEATCSMLDEDIAGAEGECLHRRHPEKKAFAGRLRKFNEQIARIRQFRVNLAAAYSEGLGSHKERSLTDASDLAYQWECTCYAEFREWILKLDTYSAKDDEQFAALERTKAKLNAASRAAKRVRNAYSEQLRQESDRALERSIA